MRTPEEKLLNPRPGSKIAAAKEFGIDLTLLIENLRLTPQQRITQLQDIVYVHHEIREQGNYTENIKKHNMVKLEPIIASLVKNEVEFVIVGELAMAYYGCETVTQVFDFCYLTSSENIEDILNAISPFNPRLRGVPQEPGFILDKTILQDGINFNLHTDIGAIDLLGEVEGVGTYFGVEKQSIEVEIYGHRVKILSLEALIKAKRRAGRKRDLLVLSELGALLELQK